MKSIPGALLLSCLLGLPLFGANQDSWPNPPWVDSGVHVAANGNDATGNGSKARPFRSIRRGIARARKNDTVYVHPGIYRETWLRMKSHTRVLGVGGPEKTKIYSGVKLAVTFSGKAEDPLRHAELDGFEIYGDYNGGKAGSGLVRVYQADRIAIRNCVLRDAPFDADVIKVSGYVTNMLLENLVIYNPAHRPKKNSSPYQENIDIYGSEPARNGKRPIRNVVIRGCWLFQTEKGGHHLMYGKVNVENMLIENNIFGPSKGYDRNRGEGFGSGGVAIGTFDGRRSYTPKFHVNRRTVVRNNIFLHCQGDAALEITDSDDIWVYNNLFYNNGGKKLRSVVQFTNSIGRNGKVYMYNNVFLHNRPERQGDGFLFRVRRSGAPDPFLRDYNLYEDNVRASSISYKGEAHGSYRKTGSYKVQLPDPLISKVPGLKDIQAIKQAFASADLSDLKGKGVNVGDMKDYPNWQPGVTDVMWDATGKARSRLSWTLGPFEAP